jgi:hypothetical protein
MGVAGHNYGRKNLIILLAISFFTAITVRLIILFSGTPYFFGGDLYSYVTFSEEIRLNGMLIPFYNVLHFPGTGFVFPPLIPFVLSPFVIYFNTQRVLEIFTLLEILIGSISTIPVYKISKSIFDHKTGVIASFIYSTFPPFIYLDIWGDFAQVAGLLLILLIIMAMISILENNNRRPSTILLAILIIILAYTHDLSFFFVIFYLLVAVVLLSLFRRSRGKYLNSTLSISLGGVLGAAIGSSWYFYHSSIFYFLTQHGLSLDDGGTVYQSIYSISVEFDIPYGFQWIVYVFFALLIITWIYLHYRPHLDKVVLIDALLAASLIPIIAFAFDPVLFSRFGYFVSLGYIFTGSFFISDLIFRKPAGNINWKYLKNALKIGTVLFIALYVSFSVVMNENAHEYYVAGGQNISYNSDCGVIHWFDSHSNRSEVIAAPQEIGFMLMAFTGNPVIVNESISLLTQHLEFEESNAAGILLHFSQNFSQLQEIEMDYHVSYVVSSTGYIGKYYKSVYSNSNYSIYMLNL